MPINLLEYSVRILPDDYRLSLPTATPPRMLAVSRVHYVETTNKPTGSGN